MASNLATAVESLGTVGIQFQNLLPVLQGCGRPVQAKVGQGQIEQEYHHCSLNWALPLPCQFLTVLQECDALWFKPNIH